MHISSDCKIYVILPLFYAIATKNNFLHQSPTIVLVKESHRITTKICSCQWRNKKQSFGRKLIEGTTYSSITNMYLFTSSEICIAVSSSSISLRLTENNKLVSIFFPGCRKYCKSPQLHFYQLVRQQVWWSNPEEHPPFMNVSRVPLFQDSAPHEFIGSPH